MQAYGAVAPSAALRSADERSSKSNGKSFLTILAGVVVLALLVGHQAHARSAPTTNLAAAQAMRAPEPAAMQQRAAAMAAAQKQQAVAKLAQGQPTHQLEEEAPAEEAAPETHAAPAGEKGDSESVDLLPPKKIKGGKAKELEESVEEAFEDKPNKDNSHYIPEHTDKEVHLLIIFFLLLGTICVYYFWKSKDAK